MGAGPSRAPGGARDAGPRQIDARLVVGRDCLPQGEREAAAGQRANRIVATSHHDRGNTLGVKLVCRTSRRRRRGQPSITWSRKRS